SCGSPLFPGTPLLTRLGGMFEHGGGGGCVVQCGAPCIPGTPLKSWLCFHPTTGKALPKLNPHPYVGPITGTFPCTSCAGAGCGPAGCGVGCGPDGCAAGGLLDPALRGGLGHGRGLAGRFGGRAGRVATCAPPPAAAFPGSKSAAPEPPAVPGKAAPPGPVGAYGPPAAPPPPRPGRPAPDPQGRPAARQ